MTEIAVARSTVDEARRRVDRIRGHVASAWEEVIAAYKHRDHEALGYGTGQAGWDAYIVGEFGESRLTLPRHQRVEHVLEASSAGMSDRAIASAAGVDRRTVQRDRDSQVAHFAPPAAPAPTFDPEPFEVDHETGEVHLAPEPPKVTGLDGKNYTRPEPKETTTKPRRRALTDTARDLGLDLKAITDRIERLADDDRFTAQKSEVAAHLRHHLAHAIEVLTDLNNQIN